MAMHGIHIMLSLLNMHNDDILKRQYLLSQNLIKWLIQDSPQSPRKILMTNPEIHGFYTHDSPGRVPIYFRLFNGAGRIIMAPIIVFSSFLNGKNDKNKWKLNETCFGILENKRKLNETCFGILALINCKICDTKRTGKINVSDPVKLIN